KVYVKTHDKHFTLFSHPGGFNPWKVAIILELLGLEYHFEFLTFGGDMKQEPYVTINPNGRVPALIDHNNNDYAIFESGAIILCLVEKYDTEHKISFETLEEKGQAWQWLMLQISVAGDKGKDRTMAKQAAYFAADEPKQWLVSNKLSYADLSFVPWNWILESSPQLEGLDKKYPEKRVATLAASS
ncbi:hypothetical protein RUND412_011578, partial [Rhizina undulata]